MNKIFKVIYSKTRHCYVVVSELAKSHCKSTVCPGKSKTALTAAVLLVLGTFSFLGMPTAQAEASVKNNDYVGANSTYWYWDTKTSTWKTYDYKLGDAFNNRSFKDLPNYNGAGAKQPGAITAGLYAQAGQQTITIGDRNAGQSRGSVFIGEHSGYTNVGDNVPAGIRDNYVTAVGFQSGATGWGSIAIGSNAVAENTMKTDTTVNEVGEIGNPKTVSDDVYGIESNPAIEGASVALGYSAKAKDGNIAIGAYSEATDTSSATPYVSVGNTTIKRRITNVADGTNTSDVATFGQLQALSKELGGYKAGFGIKIATDSTDKTKNKISLKRNLGRDANTEDKAVLKADEDKSALVIGGRVNQGDATGGQTTEKDYGALGQDSVTVGGADNTASGDAAVVVGGLSNTASAQYSAVVGGSANDAIGNESSVFGGFNNDANGTHATISGGSYNRTYGEAASVFGGSMNNAVGSTSSVFGGSINTANGIWSSVVGGSHNTTLGLSSTAVGGQNAIVDGTNSVGIAGGSTKADNALAAGNGAAVTVKNGTAIGYQATANKEGTVAFGHDKDDVYYTSTWPQKATEKDGKYYDANNNNKEITKDQYEALRNADTTFNDYSQKPTVTEKKYGSAAYNRLVKVADGQDDHDVVVMEQLDKAKSELSDSLSVNAGWGINIADEKDEKTGAVTKKNVISLDKNLGYVIESKNPYEGQGTVTLKTNDKNSFVIGSSAGIDYAPDSGKNYSFGALGDYSILVGGMNNTASGERSNIYGGYENTATGAYATIVGGYYDEASGSYSSVIGGTYNKATNSYASVFGGSNNTASGGSGAAVFGGFRNTASGYQATAVGGQDNTASGTENAAVFGGKDNTAAASFSVAMAGAGNTASGAGSAAIGGYNNVASGGYSTNSGGSNNVASGIYASSFGGIFSAVNGLYSTGVAGGSTAENARLSFAAGYQSLVTDSGVKKTVVSPDEYDSQLKQGTANSQEYKYDIDTGAYVHYDKISTALGYQATADEAGTIAFGHDAGDESGYTYEWEQLPKDKNGNQTYANDGTTNDYTKPPKSVVKKAPYTSAYYNRLVKVADGVEDHDVVVMKQLKQYAEKDAGNIGKNIKVYKTDEKGNIQLGDDKKPIVDEAKTTKAQNDSKDAWGEALGAEAFKDADAAKNSTQLINGKTLYNYDAPVAEDGKELKTVSAKNTTGQNLAALDATLNDSNHTIKYYSVDETILPKLTKFMGKDYSNEKNDGAKGMGSLAAGFNTHAEGIASTVAGSYSGVINDGNVSVYDLRGATALSYGSFNINQNTDASKAVSGVANSIIGQANVTTNSNAAIIYGAGNTVTNSYRAISTSDSSDPSDTLKFLGKVEKDITEKGAAAVAKDLQEAVPTSGGQVMVMGGGNNVDNAYMTQVTGVGNTVTGSNDAGKEYSADSTQLNYVDGFYTKLENGKNDYIIGSHNTVTGTSTDKNQSNVIFGDNHKLTNQSNNVIIGSTDSEDETKASDVVSIGHNAKVSAEGGVAIGSGSEATVEGNKVAGYDPATGVASTTETAVWKATNGAVSVGKADGSVTRQINGLAAGIKDTDAVNVAQLKKLDSKKADADAGNLTDSNVTAWQSKLGNGAVAKGNTGLVTGGTVYNYNAPAAETGKTLNYVSADKTTGQNLTALDTQVGKNTTNISTNTTNITKNAGDITNLKDLSNITDKGETVIKNLAKGTVKVAQGDRVTVTPAADEKTGAITYTVSANNDGKVAKGDTNLVSGDTVNTAITNAVNNVGTDTDNKLKGKADINAGNIGANLNYKADGTAVTDDDKTDNENAWGTAIGTGTVTAASGQLVTGKTVYDALHGGLTDITIGKDGQAGSIGLVGPKGQDGKDGFTTTIIRTETGAPGVDGKNGKDGITRIVYNDTNDPDKKHTVATLDDGLKFKGDDGKEIAKKLNDTLEIVGGVTDSTKLTDNNIGVNKTDDGKLKIQLAQELNGITSIGNQKTEAGKTTGGRITFGTDSSINVNGGKITNVGNGVEQDGTGKYTVTEQNQTNAANIGDVQNIVNDAKKELTDSTNSSLNGKANVDASNIGTNLAADKQQDNLNKWGKAIGTGTVASDSNQLVTGKTVYDEVRPKKDGNYVKANQTTGENLSALDSKIGKLDETKKYNYIDSKPSTSISDNLTKLDTQVKKNADAINDINTNMQNLSDNAVKYDDSSKSKVTLGGGESGTTIMNVKDGKLSDDSTEAVNGKQLNAVQKQVTNNTNEITKIEDGKGFTDVGTTVIKNFAKDAVQVKAGTAITVADNVDDKGNKTYTISANNNGTVAKDDGNLISGNTLYKEVYVDKDGTYIKSKDSATGKDMTVAQNLSALDTGLKTTSDLIHTNDKKDTIQIGGSSTATKIDVSGKDGKGNTTGRVITGVVTDAGDPNSAANVGYVNGLTAANTQQIYRDMNNAYSHLDRNINRAAAGSNALAALHPLDYDPADKASFAVGFGHYHNANAAAIGAFYYPNANTMVNMGVSLGNGDPGFNAGVSFKIGKGSAYNGVSKAEMAQTIHDQATEISAIKADDAAKDKRIDALEKENQEMKKQIQEILARLNG